MKFYAKITRKLRENYAKITRKLRENYEKIICKILEINKMNNFAFPKDSVKFP